MTTPVVNPPTRPAIEDYVDSVKDDTFPNNIIELLNSRFDLLALDLNLVNRMPHNDDKNYTVGFVPVVQTPNPSSWEMRGGDNLRGPTLREYLVIVYAFVKDASRERGQAAHGVLAEIVESILESDTSLRASLALLQSDVMGSQKRYSRHYIRQARYLANEIGGNHLFLSASEVIFEVEKTS